MKNVYLISNSFKSFYLFRKEIINELSKKHNLLLVANEDEYSNYFRGKVTCIKFNNLFNRKSFFSNLKIIFILFFLFLKKKPHLVQTYTIHPNLICLPIAKLFMSSTVAMITGMGSLSITNSKILKKIFDLVYKFSFSFCDHIIFVNNDNKNYFTNILKIKKKSITIHGAGIDLKRKPIIKKNLKHALVLKKNFNIVFVGRIIIEKGVLDAIKLFKLLNIPEKKLIFAGGFDSSAFSKKVNKNIFNYPGIIFLNHQKEVNHIYEIADIFILPSRTEGMPTSLMEAIKFNVPTVSYKIPGVRDVIKNNLNGMMVKPGDIISASNKINSLYKSRNLRNIILSNSLKLKNKFDRKKIIQKVLLFYDDIINK